MNHMRPSNKILMFPLKLEFSKPDLDKFYPGGQALAYSPRKLHCTSLDHHTFLLKSVKT